MAALTATDWTVTVEDRVIEGKHKRNRCLLSLATAGSYPSGGIPIPESDDLGLVRNLDYLIPFDTDPDTGYVVKYDHPDGTLRIYGSSTASSAFNELTELATTVTVGATMTTLYVEAVGW